MRLRLILSFFVIVLVAILSTVFIVRLNTPQQVQNFMLRGGMQGLDTLSNELEAYYNSKGSWDGVESIMGGNGMGMMGAGHGSGTMGQRIILADVDGLVISDSADRLVGTTLSDEEKSASIQLKKRSLTVGYLLAKGGMQVSNGAQQPLINRLNDAALQAGLIALVIAFVLAIILAEGILKPVRQLTRAAELVAAGDWSHEVPAKGKDELAALARSFNAMVDSLRQSEERRQGMTADIAHELRTPLAVQRAHLEAMQDGIYPITAESLQPVLDQNGMLVRLVDDLRTLALADAGELQLEKQSVNAREFLLGMQERFRSAAEERNVEIVVSESQTCPSIMADPDRLAQIFTNLIGNALRYAPEGGKIILAAECTGNEILITVSDNGPGIPAEALPAIFDRFYRVDKARSREEGGSGLGLAIARQLAGAHGGKLSAENLPQGGARFTLSIPKVD
jgi:two-component system sensor histidine kinase BaeS